MGQENKWTTGYVFLERIFLRHVLQFLGGIFTILQNKNILQNYFTVLYSVLLYNKWFYISIYFYHILYRSR